MKRTLIVASFLIIFSSFVSIDEFSNPEYFQGRWNVTVYGTPQGDATIPMRFEAQEGALNGFFYGDMSGQESEMDTVYINDGTLNAAFFIGGYDVTISLSEVDKDNSAGFMLNMFELKGVRVQE